MLRALLCLALIAATAQSRSLAAAEQLPELLVEDSVVIAATGEVQQSEYTGSHAQVSQRRLLQNSESLAATLAQEAGVQLRQSGGAGSYSTLSMRGSSSAQTAVYLDGVLLNSASTGSVDLAELELLNLAAVDLYRGSTPMALGSGGLGGAVNLLSRAVDQDTTVARLGVGSFGARQLGLSHSRQVRRWHWLGALSHQSSDNDFSFTHDNGTPLNTDDDRDSYRQHAAYARDSLLLKASRHQGRHEDDVLLQLSQRALELPDWLNREDSAAALDTDNLQLSYARRVMTAEVDGFNQLTRFYINRHRERYEDLNSRIGLGRQRSNALSDVKGIRHYREQLSDYDTVAFSGELRHETLDYDDRLQHRDWQARRWMVESLLHYTRLGRQEQDLFNGTIVLQAIDDRWQAQSGAEDQASSMQLLPRLGVQRALNAHWSWRANAGRYHRQPVFMERFGDRGLYVGNPDLEAEQGYNLDAAVMFDKRGYRLELVAFHNTRENQIVIVHDARGIGRSENTQRAQSRGIELMADFDLVRDLDFASRLTWQDAENRSDSRAERGKQLPGQARLALHARLEFERGPWQLWYGFDLQKERYYDTANLLAAEDYALHAVGARFKRSAWSVSIKLDNLGDETVEDFNGYPRPGRSWQVALAFTPEKR